MSFEINYQELHEIDVTPNGVTRTYKRLGAGISSVDPETNEDIDQSQYIADDGNGSSTVLSMQLIMSCSGHRLVGDEAQDYIASVRMQKGSGRNSNYRFTDASGNQLSGACTLANVKIGGGDAAGKKEISFEVHMNGKPSETIASPAAALTSVVAAGTVSGTTKFTATPGVSNTLAYKLLAESAGTVNGNSYLDGYIPYTSGANIAATVGQFLQMFEIDTNKRVVKFAETELASGDIMA